MSDNNLNDLGGIDAKKVEFDQHVDKCLSMMYHHPEVEKFAIVVKRIGHKRLSKKAVSDEQD